MSGAFEVIDADKVTVSMAPDFAYIIGELLKTHGGSNSAIFAFASQIMTEAGEIKPQLLEKKSGEKR